METKDKLLNKEIKKLTDEGVSRPTAISLALDKVGISKVFNADNTRKEVEDKNKGGYLKDKGKRNWPTFK